jgi:hypothetical protein|tara:strand:- start:61 stop:444 length:384 start_codon:yes stop_codon:yes gene_type:complete
MIRRKPGTFHYGKSNDEYVNLIKLHDTYKLKKPPIDELKAACLADGYPQERVDKLHYIDMSDWDIDEILGKKSKTVKTKSEEPKPEEPKPEEPKPNESDSEADESDVEPESEEEVDSDDEDERFIID